MSVDRTSDEVRQKIKRIRTARWVMVAITAALALVLAAKGDILIGGFLAVMASMPRVDAVHDAEAHARGRSAAPRRLNPPVRDLVSRLLGAGHDVRGALHDRVGERSTRMKSISLEHACGCCWATASTAQLCSITRK